MFDYINRILSKNGLVLLNLGQAANKVEIHVSIYANVTHKLLYNHRCSNGVLCGWNCECLKDQLALTFRMSSDVMVSSAVLI